MNDSTDAINNLIIQIQKGPLNYFLAMASLGVLTMSIVQALKNLLPWRRVFHRAALRAWLQKRVGGKCSDCIEQSLIRLAADGNSRALYDADTEELCRNLEAVGRLLVDYPTHDNFEKLLTVMTSSQVASDITKLTDKGINGDSRVEARDRVRQHLAQSLNAFRLSTAAQWQRQLHLVSLGISFVIAIFAVLWSGKANWLWAPVSSLLAAFVAPVARDMVAGIENLRKSHG